MHQPTFVLNEPVNIDESRYCEFKEVKGRNPLDSIKNTSDEYAVAYLNSGGGRIFWGIRDSDHCAVGVRLTSSERDRLRRIVTERLFEIKPAISPNAFEINLYPVWGTEAKDEFIGDHFIVELIAPRPLTNALYSTASGDVFVKTDAGKRKLTFEELQDEILRRHGRSRLSHTERSDSESEMALANGVEELVKRVREIQRGIPIINGMLATIFARFEKPTGNGTIGDQAVTIPPNLLARRFRQAWLLASVKLISDLRENSGRGWQDYTQPKGRVPRTSARLIDALMGVEQGLLAEHRDIDDESRPVVWPDINRELLDAWKRGSEGGLRTQRVMEGQTGLDDETFFTWEVRQKLSEYPDVLPAFDACVRQWQGRQEMPFSKIVQTIFFEKIRTDETAFQLFQQIVQVYARINPAPSELGLGTSELKGALASFCRKTQEMPVA